MLIPFCLKQDDPQAVGCLAVFGSADALTEFFALRFGKGDLANLTAHRRSWMFSPILPYIAYSRIFTEP